MRKKQKVCAFIIDLWPLCLSVYLSGIYLTLNPSMRPSGQAKKFSITVAECLRVEGLSYFC